MIENVHKSLFDSVFYVATYLLGSTEESRWVYSNLADLSIKLCH